MEKARMVFVRSPEELASVDRNKTEHDDLIGERRGGGAWVYDWSLTKWKKWRRDHSSEVRHED